MAKPKKPAKAKAPKEVVQISYKTVHGTHHSVPLKVPVAAGHGEALLNAAEQHGAEDLEAVRAQIRKHY